MWTTSGDRFGAEYSQYSVCYALTLPVMLSISVQLTLATIAVYPYAHSSAAI